jgi:hypothetical protein
MWMPSPQPVTTDLWRAVRLSGRAPSGKGYHDNHVWVKLALTHRYPTAYQPRALRLARRVRRGRQPAVQST